MNLSDLKSEWEDSEIFHKTIHEAFISNVESVEWINAHREWVQTNIFGFGEKSFHWLWKLIVDEMPSEFSFLEVGVFRAQILSLIKMLASAEGKKVERYGVTPLDNSGGMWESDYENDIKHIHDTFFIPKDYQLYVGSSTNVNIIEQAYRTSPYNIVYIDGSHERIDVDSDLKHYAPMVKKGGYLVIDDCNNNFHMPWGFFQGISDVTEAKLAWIEENGIYWEFVCSVVHISVFQRI